MWRPIRNSFRTAGCQGQDWRTPTDKCRTGRFARRTIFRNNTNPTCVLWLGGRKPRHVCRVDSTSQRLGRTQVIVAKITKYCAVLRWCAESQASAHPRSWSARVSSRWSAPVSEFGLSKSACPMLGTRPAKVRSPCMRWAYLGSGRFSTALDLLQRQNLMHGDQFVAYRAASSEIRASAYFAVLVDRSGRKVDPSP